MRNITILTSVLTVLFCGCSYESSNNRDTDLNKLLSPQDSVPDKVDRILIDIGQDSVLADIVGVDSLIVFSLYRDDEKKYLFSVANGGSVECLSDSILSFDNQTTVMFTFADYSQVDQIFYILFNCDKNTFIQSGRINLSHMGMTINDAKSFCIDSIAVDSIYISSPDINFATDVLPIDCDSNKIINYYEYQ